MYKNYALIGHGAVLFGTELLAFPTTCFLPLLLLKKEAEG
jgi:hypothetical protein